MVPSLSMHTSQAASVVQSQFSLIFSLLSFYCCAAITAYCIPLRRENMYWGTPIHSDLRTASLQRMSRSIDRLRYVINSVSACVSQSVDRWAESVTGRLRFILCICAYIKHAKTFIRRTKYSWYRCVSCRTLNGIFTLLISHPSLYSCGHTTSQLPPLCYSQLLRP